MPRRERACPIANPAENKNAENAWRDMLDNQHRLKGSGFKQCEPEPPYGRDIVAGDDKAIRRAFGHL